MIVVLTGPESSGKTTLATALAVRYACPWVPEYARDYLRPGQAYTPRDLLAIAHAQSAAERSRMGEHELLVVDTDVQTIRIWWQERYGPAPAPLSRDTHLAQPRMYLLCKPDMPWQPDALRENPLDRDRLFDIYVQDLKRRDAEYLIVHGTLEQRIRDVCSAIDGARARRAP